MARAVIKETQAVLCVSMALGHHQGRTLCFHSENSHLVNELAMMAQDQKIIILVCVCFYFSVCLTQETGLVVMTDMVSLNHRQSGGMYTDEAVPAFQPHTSTLVAAMHSRSTTRYRTRCRDVEDTL